MKKSITFLFLMCVLSTSIFAKEQMVELKPIEQMGKPFNAFGGLKLDSMTYFNNNVQYAFDSKATKYVYEYSRDGRVNVKAYYDDYDDANQVWIGYNKDEYTYLPGGNIIYKNYGWDDTTLDWALSRQVNDEYDSNAHNTSTTYFDWDATNNFLNMSSKKEYAYDSNDNIITITTFLWSNLKWVNSEKTNYTYDKNRNLTSTISSKWSNNSWVNDTKLVQEFNSLNQLTSKEIYQWNTTQKAWVPLMNYNYVYKTSGAANGKIYTESQWLWDNSQNEYVAYAKTRYTYDDNGFLQIEESLKPAGTGYLWNTNTTETYVRDSQGNVLSYVYESVSAGPISRYTYTYDDRSNRITTTAYEWDSNSETWIISDVERRIYDAYNNLLSITSFDSQNEQTNVTTYYYSASDYYPIDIDGNYTYTWNGEFPKQWYTGDSIAVVTKINNNNEEPFSGSLALQLVNDDDEDISQFVAVLNLEDSVIESYNYQFVRFEGKLIVPAGNYLVYLLYKESATDNWKLAGVTEGHYNPDTFVVSTKPIIKEYVILAQRKTNANWYYLTSVNAGTEYTPHLEAINSGTNDKTKVQRANLEDKFIWTIEESDSNVLLKNGEEYISYSSGNTAYMSANGKLLTQEAGTPSDLVCYTFIDSGNNKRYLSLNTTNDYFSFYKGTQAQNLLVLEYGENTATYIENTNINHQTANKILHNGQIFIIRGDKTFTVTGQEVK